MNVLMSETVPGVGRVEAVVDDEGYTVIKFWKHENTGARPDTIIEMSPRMGDAAGKLMAQYGAAAVPLKSGVKN